KTVVAAAWDEGKWWQRWVWGRRDLLISRGTHLTIGQKLDEDDLEAVLEGQPWLFRKHLVLFDRLIKPMERDQIRLVSSPFWVKIGPCLPEFDKKDLLHAIGVTYGGVLRSEIMGEFCRLRIKLNVQKPLRRGIFVSTGTGHKCWIPFKYEKLPTFCFGSGRVGHEIDEKETENSKADGVLMRPIKKATWRRLEPVEVMRHYKEESKLQKRKLVEIIDDDYEDTTKRMKYDIQTLLNEDEISLLIEVPEQNISVAAKRQADRTQ
ncbi:hypothetical protein Goshw_017120, partial [Gossypium schwendimanii]|nr:hypothetical protein [Gossypium schwendimanii]